MLEVRDVHAGYGKSRILHGISLSVPEGQVVALLGGNGTGKSTALKTITGLVVPSSGEVHFDGRRIDGQPANRMISLGLCLVPQGKEVFNGMSVEENLLMGAFHRRVDKAGIAEDLANRYRQFPRLAERRRVAAGSLSGGERQMLSIGRALMARPRLLLLDEPSAALAPKVIDEISDIVYALKEQGLTILLVEQNISMALDLADHLYIMRDGRIALDRPVDAGMEMADLRAFYLGGEDVA